MSISNRFFRVAIVAGMLLIPLMLVLGLVTDRSYTRDQVTTDVTRGWAAEQSVGGMMLALPFTQEVDVSTDKGPVRKSVADTYLIAPERLTVISRLQPELRRRSLFDIIVYKSATTLQAHFAKTVIDATIDAGAVVDWNKASIVFGVGDSRGLGGTIPAIIVAGRRIEGQPLDGGGDGVTLGAPLTAAGPIADLDVSAQLVLKGSQSFSVGGLAKHVTVAISSNWPHPSFLGRILPDAYRVGEQGFSAQWTTGSIALGRPLTFRSSGLKAAWAAPQIARVELIQPVDLYAQVGRAVKYGALFIALTLLAFFIFDATGRRRLPMLAYALVGLGLVLFYLLLLALAEYLSLLPAYLIAAAAMIGLITTYAKAVLESARRAGIIAGVLSTLYAALYVLLQLEQFALLLGSVILFAALTAVMYVTRDLKAEDD